MSGETRIDGFWFLRVITNNRIADINPKNGSSCGIILKNSADIYIQEIHAVLRRGTNKKLRGRTYLSNDFISVEANKARSNFSENSEVSFSDSDFRSEKSLKFSAALYLQ